MRPFLVYALMTSLVLIVVSLGLRVTIAQLRDEIARPASLLRALFAIGIVMPLLTLLAVRVLRLEPLVEASLVALAMSPLPPALTLKHDKLGSSDAYSATLLAVTGICAIVLIPFWMVVANRTPGLEGQVGTGAVARTIVIGLVAPIIVGVAIRAAAPRFAERIATPLRRAATLVLLAIAVMVIGIMWPEMKRLVGDGTLAVLAAFSIVGLAVGHLLGDREPGRRAALAVAVGARHPALAIAVATVGSLPRQSVVAAMLWHLLLAAFVALPYLYWQKRRAIAALVPQAQTP